MSAGTPQAAAIAAPPVATGAAVPPAPAAAPSPIYTPPPSAVAPSAATPPMAPPPGQKRMFGGFFGDINVLDVTISAFIVGAVIYSIQYHKFMMLIEKTGYADLSTRVQKLESSLEAAKKKAEMNATGSNMRRKKRLVTL